jgi:hypothetical protein
MSAHRIGLMSRSSRGRRTRQRHMGFSRNLGDPVVPISTEAGVWNCQNRSSWSLGRRRARGKRRKQTRGMVPPSEGNEARREGRREVGASRSTCEAGESPSLPRVPVVRVLDVPFMVELFVVRFFDSPHRRVMSFTRAFLSPGQALPTPARLSERLPGLSPVLSQKLLSPSPPWQDFHLL